ncbi:protein FAR1-RELATED SEQUENCE 5-like [Arachis duranensis]|uniref:Protein FAR1-RELATED SEQUENCE 5-like n=1 Tax=Arachis duranensis TaxID=130453 RepID=A0A6P4CRS5_ARADU|nr:protein FAR1-RELATED SEQUENCE 5-like [Arachis duranensis]
MRRTQGSVVLIDVVLVRCASCTVCYAVRPLPYLSVEVARLEDCTLVADGFQEYAERSGGVDDVAEGRLSRPVSAKDFLGKDFATEEDAYAAYKEFTKLRGFGVRKGDVSRVNGVLIRRDFSAIDHVQDVLSTMTVLSEVRTIVDKHNHELSPAMFAHLLPSHRKMSDGDKTQVDSLKQFGIATSKMMAYMAGQSCGYGMLQFTKQDLYNYVHRQKIARICDADTAATISYLEDRANADMKTVARYTQTLDNQLGSLFRAHSKMTTDYQLFGDV